jgi:hypothetical protein
MGLVALPSSALPTGTRWGQGNIGFHPIGRRRLSELEARQPPLKLSKLAVTTKIQGEVLGPLLLSKDDLARRTEPRPVIGVKGSRLNSSGPARTVHSGRSQARS